MAVDTCAPEVVPLSGHVLFQSDDLDCARERVAQKFCSHRLDIIGDKSFFRAAHHHVKGAMLSLNYIDYGADVLIDPGELSAFFLIQMPISGFATIRNGKREFGTDSGTGCMLNADRATRMQWWRGCRQLLIQIDKAPFVAFVERLIERPLPGPLIFDPVVDFSRPEMTAWRRLANCLFRLAEGAPANPQCNLWHLFQEEQLLECFLRNQPSNISVFLEDRRPSGAPHYVKRAEAFIRENARRDISLCDIAQATGVSARTLQLAYGKTFGVSPMTALVQERMRGARYDLLDDRENRSVTEVALDWGFGHLGRFASLYRRRYGETPRETLRAARV